MKKFSAPKGPKGPNAPRVKEGGAKIPPTKSVKQPKPPKSQAREEMKKSMKGKY
jgi:hypothetical protein